MRIKILSSAVEDLHAGRLFYEVQAEGIGEYFFDSLFADIDSLRSMQVSTQEYSVITASCPDDSHTPCITDLKTIWPSCGEC